VDPNTPWAEWFNALGNHIGSRNFGLEVESKKHKISLYWQNIFEDGSGKAYRNIKDADVIVIITRKMSFYFRIDCPFKTEYVDAQRSA